MYKEIQRFQETSPIDVIERDQLLRNLYRLACHFLASEEMADRCALYESHATPLQELAWQFQETEIADTLLKSALHVRLLDDQLMPFPKVQELFQVEVGTLAFKLDSTPVDTQTLSLREACNKILHADTFRYFVDIAKHPEYEEQTIMGPLAPQIATYGKTQNGKSYRTEIKIREYVEAGYNLAVWAPAALRREVFRKNEWGQV